MPMPSLTIDPEFQAIIPSLTPDEYNRLQASIIKDGCLSPLVAWGDIILDGHNRYEICRANKRGFSLHRLKFSDRDDAKRWIINNQMGRRNLDASQRAMLAGQLAKLRPGQHAPSSVNLPSTSAIALKQGVSVSAVTQARKVIDQGGAPLQKAVTDGKVAVSAAAKVATLPKPEQAALVKAGPKAVAAKAKEMSEPKKEPPAPVLVDAVGRPLPTENPGLLAAFAGVAEVTALMAEVAALKRKVAGIAETNPALAKLSVSDFEIIMDNARLRLLDARPHAVCPYCAARPKDGCEACKGSGWVNKFIYVAAPKELKLHEPV